MKIIARIKEYESYGFYFINLWKHCHIFAAKFFILLDIGWHKYEKNWSVRIRILNFDFGYISKPKGENHANSN